MAETPLSVHAPGAEPRGGLVVIQEAFGVNPHIEDVCARLVSAGYLAVAPHLFHRTGDPQLSYEDLSEVMPHMMALTAETITDDLDAAFAHLAAQGFAGGATGIVGFCMGGTVALWTATQRDLGAAVTFYGGGVAEGRFGLPSLIDAAPSIRCPWLGLYADLDKGIPVDDVEQLRTAAATSSQPTEIVRYADAEHGFNCDRRASYHEPSATDAWACTLAWFDTYLTKGA